MYAVAQSNGTQMLVDEETQWWAEFGPLGLGDPYRYSLGRPLGNGKEGLCVFVCANPSSATHAKNDPTVRKAMQFTDKFGCGEFIMLNIFAFRATDPEEMYKVEDPVGPFNDSIIEYHVKRADQLVCAWGDIGKHRNRSFEVWDKLYDLFSFDLCPEPRCFKKNKSGTPKHPLYVAYAAELEPYYLEPKKERK